MKIYKGEIGELYQVAVINMPMKQHISQKEINELSPKAKERLQKWWTPKAGDWIISKARGTYLIYGREEDFDEDYNEPELISDQETDSGYYGWCIDDTFPTKPVPEKYDFEYAKGKVERAKRILDNTLPLLSIGQLIEYLDEHDTELDIFIEKIGDWRVEMDHGKQNTYSEKSTGEHKELCDALWQAVKKILEK